MAQKKRTVSLTLDRHEQQRLLAALRAATRAAFAEQRLDRLAQRALEDTVRNAVAYAWLADRDQVADGRRLRTGTTTHWAGAGPSVNATLN